MTMAGSIKYFIFYAIINLSLTWNEAVCDDSILELKEEIDSLLQELKKSNDFVNGMNKRLGALSRQVMPANWDVFLCAGNSTVS
jgi:hypothetical protein